MIEWIVKTRFIVAKVTSEGDRLTVVPHVWRRWKGSRLLDFFHESGASEMMRADDPEAPVITREQP